MEGPERPSWPATASTGHVLPRHAWVAVVLALTILLVTGCERGKTPGAERRGPPDAITLATTPFAGLTPVYIALAKGYFDDEGLKVTVQSHTSGKAALDAVLAGTADVATVAELPVTLAALKGLPVAVLATLATGEGDYGMVGRKDAGISGAATLKGKRVAVTFVTSADFFLDALLIRQRLSRSDVQAINRKREDIASALQNDEADAAVIWEPYLSALAKRLGGNAVVLDGKGIYEGTLNIAATSDFAARRGETVKKLLRALLRAEQFFADDRPAAEQIVAQALGSTPAETQQLLSKYRFSLSLDQSLLVMMEDEAHWAVKGRHAEAKAEHNFLNNIYVTGLQAVEPRAVTVIH